MPEIKTRPARPEEAALGAHLIFLSGPAAFAYGLALPPERVEALLRSLWARPGNLFSHSWSYLAVVNGQAQGLLLGYTGAQLPGAMLATARALWGRVSLRQLATMARRGWQLQRISPRVPRGDYYIAHLAVLPGARRQGIGAHLLGQAERIARQEGCRRCSLDVFIENEAARRLYQRTGYAVERTLHNPRLVGPTGYSGLTRMTKPLPVSSGQPHLGAGRSRRTVSQAR